MNAPRLKSTVTRLPSSLCRQPDASVLRFNNRKKIPLHRLPFVDARRGKTRVSFWAVPKSGGYGGGCQTGAALARIYMKHLREHGGCSLGTLQLIVLGMFDCLPEEETTTEQDALHGQVVGFFSEIDKWLPGAAKYLNRGLNEQDNETLLEMANAGIASDSK